MADFSEVYSLSTAVTGKTSDEKYSLYHNVKAACDDMRNNKGLVAYSKIESVTLDVSGNLNTSSNPAKMGAYWLNSSGGYTKLTTDAQDTEMGGSLGEKWITGLNVTSKFNSENPDSGYVSSSYGGASANHIEVRFIHAWLLTSFTYSTKYKLTFNFNKPRAIVTVSGGSGGGTYAYDSSIKLTANSKAGHTHSGWSCSNGKTYTVKQLTDGLAVKDVISAYETKLTFTPTYTANKYTVTWKNADGTVLETDTGVAYGTTPTYNGSTPTKAYDSSNHYTFKAWSPAVGAISGNTTYTATFNSVAHSYATETAKTPATCTATGSVTKKCSCGATQISTLAKDPNNHSGSQTTLPAVAATCEKEGSTAGKKWSCCNTIITAQQVVPALGHSYTSQVIAATAAVDGYTLHTCQNGCGSSYKDNYTINKIFIGTTQPKKIYFGTQEVKEVYFGTTKVYGLR